MEFNKNFSEGKWTEIKGDIQKAWGKITDDELEKTKGDLTAIKGIIQQKYGASQSDYEDRFDQIYKKFKNYKEEKMESIKNSLKH